MLLFCLAVVKTRLVFDFFQDVKPFSDWLAGEDVCVFDHQFLNVLILQVDDKLSEILFVELLATYCRVCEDL